MSDPPPAKCCRSENDNSDGNLDSEGHKTEVVGKAQTFAVSEETFKDNTSTPDLLHQLQAWQQQDVHCLNRPVWSPLRPGDQMLEVTCIHYYQKWAPQRCTGGKEKAFPTTKSFTGRDESACHRVQWSGVRWRPWPAGLMCSCPDPDHIQQAFQWALLYVSWAMQPHNSPKSRSAFHAGSIPTWNWWWNMRSSSNQPHLYLALASRRQRKDRGHAVRHWKLTITCWYGDRALRNITTYKCQTSTVEQHLGKEKNVCCHNICVNPMKMIHGDEWRVKPMKCWRLLCFSD